MAIKTKHDYIIIGAGIYGLYAANRLALKYPNKKIVLIERDSKPFQRASYINQSRIHNGYHYPRSLSTALKSIGYYDRFIKDYSFAVNSEFEKIYATSSDFSYCSGHNFESFCKAANIPCNKVKHNKYFKNGLIDGAYLTKESVFDAKKICEYFLSRISDLKNIEIKYNTHIKSINESNNNYEINIDNKIIVSNFVINTTYASVNQIIDLFGFEKFKIKYEIAELALCSVSDNIKNAGLTVMDGPFFSIMPFGMSGYHVLSSVEYTPHKTSHNQLPNFNCQVKNDNCSADNLDNCNLCHAKPKTAWSEMRQLTKKYLNDDIDMTYKSSLFAIKPILEASQLSDSRPTIIKQFSSNPTFISVLSGKVNTLYDLDDIL